MYHLLGYFLTNLENNSILNRFILNYIQWIIVMILNNVNYKLNIILNPKPRKINLIWIYLILRNWIAYSKWINYSCGISFPKFFISTFLFFIVKYCMQYPSFYALFLSFFYSFRSFINFNTFIIIISLLFTRIICS